MRTCLVISKEEPSEVVSHTRLDFKLDGTSSKRTPSETDFNGVSSGFSNDAVVLESSVFIGLKIGDNSSWTCNHNIPTSDVLGERSTVSADRDDLKA